MKSQNEIALLEIGTEELPARFFYEAIEQLKRNAEKKLKESRLTFESIEAFGTPRRLVLKISGVPARQPDLEKEVRGPAKASAYDSDGNPTQALLGFLKGQNVTVEKSTFKEFSGKPYVVVTVQEIGKPTEKILEILFAELIRSLSFPKSMRWDGKFAFGRPIRWILSLFAKSPVRFSLERLESGELTYGHRFLSPKPIEIKSPDEYEKKLEQAFVIANHETRKLDIQKQAIKLAESKNGNVYRIELLLDEVTLLVEYPTPFLGTFDKRFLALPQDVLITVMQHHQRYFPIIDKDGKLLPYFIAVRNGNEEGLDEVTLGNERVIAARFKDAEYFLEMDKKTKLIDRLPALSKLIFQKNLGTIAQKVERIKPLASFIAKAFKVNAEELTLAATLSKCDLATQMVFEFPELQGVMGTEYATREGYPKAVAAAIAEHYLPRYQGDRTPESDLGILIGLADRIDTLVCCFALKLKPTGSSDPLGLRRHATAILQILIEKKLSLNVKALIEEAYKEYKKQFPGTDAPELGILLQELGTFFKERVDTLWKGLEIRYDLIRALEPLILENPYEALLRAQFLQAMRTKQKEKFTSFVTAWIRIFNILKSKEAKETLKNVTTSAIDPKSFNESEEKKLAELLATKTLNGNLEERWKILSEFEGPINQFFEKVLVMAEDSEVRRQRLALLSQLQNLMLTSFGNLTELVLD